MNAGQERTALAGPAAVLSDALQQAVLPLQPQSVQDFGIWSSVRCGCLGRNAKCCKLRVRPEDSTSTPRRRDRLFFFRTFLVLFVEASVFCLGEYSLPITGRVSPVTCLLGLRGMYYRLCGGVALYFFCFRIIFYWRCHFFQESFGIHVRSVMGIFVGPIIK